ncbi:2'-5' RNA ligase family protein [Muricoccus radiodurans]|uniref:2'-5' RNA ligase family protein n=1 Tax=Muricoccus radiodurans TaxID=2231721 RepID=UPI003CF38437
MIPLLIQRNADGFEADPLFGTPCESYQLQIALSDEEAVAGLQRAVLDAAPGAFHAMPRHGFHITVLPLMDAAERLSEPKAALWARHSGAWRNAIARACAALPPLRIRFDSLRYDRQAVIALDLDNPLSAFRNSLAGPCSLPERRIRLPRITHATLARVRDPAHVRLAEAERAGGAEFAVRELRLIHETTFPTLAYEVLEVFPLPGQLSPQSAGLAQIASGS